MKEVDFEGYRFYEDTRIINLQRNKRIKKHINKNHYEIKLHLREKPKNYIFHRLYYYLMVEKFDINDRNLCVSAKDGNLLNVSIENLELKHRKDLIQGQLMKKSKLTDIQVEEIRKLYEGKSSVNQFNKQKLSYQDLADMYKVSKGTIASIIRGRCRNKEKYILK